MTDQKRRTWLEKLDIQYARLQADLAKVQRDLWNAKQAKDQAKTARFSSREGTLLNQLKDTKDRLVRGWETARQ